MARNNRNFKPESERELRCWKPLGNDRAMMGSNVILFPLGVEARDRFLKEAKRQKRIIQGENDEIA